MAQFSDMITIRGEEYEFDSEMKVVRVYCENCGHANEIECEEVDGELTFFSFSCENCGYFNEFN
ncbi:hypothetical protein [Desulfovibrio inopinatus]|uniref:hypothetical protein n=1 Tax=Desulfovibrio inopinatus TaxID=102109 RepID=UPI0004010963|nr:hypothetical protein [Desulfovibrio inopinatus]